MADKKNPVEPVEPTKQAEPPADDVVLAGTVDIAKVPGVVKVAYPKIDGSSVVITVETN